MLLDSVTSSVKLIVRGEGVINLKIYPIDTSYFEHICSSGVVDRCGGDGSATWRFKRKPHTKSMNISVSSDCSCVS